MLYLVHDASLTRQDEEQTILKLRIVRGPDGSRLASKLLLKLHTSLRTGHVNQHGVYRCW